MRSDNFIRIEGGSAMLGQDASELPDKINCVREEICLRPCSLVTLQSFMIQKTAVTVRDFADYVCATGRDAVALGVMDSEPDFPATSLTWFEAKRYARWIGARLPTEDEWEFAVSKGLDQSEWWRNHDVGAPSPYARLQSVGTKPQTATENGIEDCLGLIDEWTSSVEEWLFNGRTTRRVVVKGSPYNMALIGPARRFVLNPRDRWSITGFRCVRDC